MNLGAPRVLIIAHEFSWQQGSECSIGWNCCTELSKHCQVTVLAARGSQKFQPFGDEYIKAWKKITSMDSDIKKNLNVVFIGYPKLAQLIINLNYYLHKGDKSPIGNPILYYIALVGWENMVRKYINTHKLEHDFVHHITPISFSAAAGLHRLELPYFIGPIGGMNIVPWSFLKTQNAVELIKEIIRNLSIISRRVLSVNFRLSVKRAENIFTISEDELRYVRDLCPTKGIPLIDTAPPPGLPLEPKSWNGDRRLKIVWSGSDEARKSLPILLNSINHERIKKHISLIIIGNGSLHPKWRQLSIDLGVDSVITWCGHIPFEEAKNKMCECDLLIHTSFREAATAVILEAVGFGIPVICHDIGGMGEAINVDCGIKVPFISPEESIARFREAIIQIINNPEKIQSFSKGTMRRAKELNWETKIRTILAEYEKLSCFRHSIQMNDSLN